jgi:hypothetical protein
MSPLRGRLPRLNVHRLTIEIDFNVLAGLAQEIRDPGCVSNGDISL